MIEAAEARRLADQVALAVLEAAPIRDKIAAEIKAAAEAGQYHVCLNFPRSKLFYWLGVPDHLDDALRSVAYALGNKGYHVEWPTPSALLGPDPPVKILIEWKRPKEVQ